MNKTAPKAPSVACAVRVVRVAAPSRLADPTPVPRRAPPAPTVAVDDLRGAYLGSIDAQPRGVAGALTLDVLADRDSIEVGPYQLDRRAAQRLFVLLNLGLALLSARETV